MFRNAQDRNCYRANSHVYTLKVLSGIKAYNNDKKELYCCNWTPNILKEMDNIQTFILILFIYLFINNLFERPTDFEGDYLKKYIIFGYRRY